VSQSSEDLLRFLRGLEKKHGSNAELVIKHTNAANKVKRLTGRFLGLRGSDVGLRNTAWKADKWIPVERLVDAWKPGTER